MALTALAHRADDICNMMMDSLESFACVSRSTTDGPE